MAMQNKPARRVVSQVNNTTRRYPRTLNEAFGPHHHLAPLVEKYDPMPTSDKSVVFMCCAIGAIVLLMALVGWL